MKRKSYYAFKWATFLMCMLSWGRLFMQVSWLSKQGGPWEMTHYWSKQLQQILGQRSYKCNLSSCTTLSCHLIEKPVGSEVQEKASVLRNLPSRQTVPEWRFDRVAWSRQTHFPSTVCCLYFSLQKLQLEHLPCFSLILWLSACCSVMHCDFPM